jgi:hypothetical protein
MPPRRAPRHALPPKEPETYRGRRRWPEPVRRRLIAGLIVLTVGLVIAGLAFQLPQEPRPDNPPAARRSADAGGTDDAASAGATPEQPVSGQPVPEQPEPAPAPGRGSPPTQTAQTGQPPFTPIQIEAEDARNTVAGSAQRVSYGTASGGVLVRDLGGSGSLTVPVSVPTGGEYTLLVRVAIPEGPATLTLVVTPSGSLPVAVPVTGRALCCSNGLLTVALRAGANWINFGNPSERAPAIDFIRITQAKG